MPVFWLIFYIKKRNVNFKILAIISKKIKEINNVLGLENNFLPHFLINGWYKR